MKGLKTGAYVVGTMDEGIDSTFLKLGRDKTEKTCS